MLEEFNINNNIYQNQGNIELSKDVKNKEWGIGLKYILGRLEPLRNQIYNVTKQQLVNSDARV